MKNNASRERLLDSAFLEVYQNGYHGAATAEILLRSGVPKGSMYHHFDSKKSLVLAVISERIFPKMDLFFNFEPQKDETVTEVLKRTFEAIADNHNLISFGCPLYRLIVEMASLDSDFDTLLTSRYLYFVSALKSLLDLGVTRKEFVDFDTQGFAEFAITSTWGRLSLSPALSTKAAFLTHTKHILALLKIYHL